jgi:predicted nuclease of predicted toxin-antitoxin system
VNFVCDEGVDRSVVTRLRTDGHDVVYIAELSPSIPDEEVLGEANQRGAVLVTADKDFGEFGFQAWDADHGCIAPSPWRSGN